MASVLKVRRGKTISRRHTNHRITKIMKPKDNVEEFGGLTKREVEMLDKIKTGKAQIITCNDSNELFKKLKID